ncbi:MAG TPA: phage/plasmid primase, P4 family, partial [Candidatus Obscuribacterales bacterium]
MTHNQGISDRRISDAVIAEIKSRVDVVEFISEHVALKQSGKNYVGLCPFHQEKSGSFSVTPENGLYYCFGCQDGGDVFKFLMELGKCSFEDAVAELGQRCGVAVPEVRDRSQRRQPIKARNIPKQKKSQMLPPPSEGEVKLARLVAPAEDIPQPIKDFDQKHGEVTKTIYPYARDEAGNLQRWTVRIEWVNPSKSKGYEKKFLPCHRAVEGEQVPLPKKKDQPQEYRTAKDGETIYSKGDAAWEAYRRDEAIASINSVDGLTALLVQEGEGCVELARSIGLASLTFQGGSWTTESMMDDFLRLREIQAILVMLRDYDEAGEKKAKLFLECCAVYGVFGIVINPNDLLLPDEGQLQKGSDLKELLAVISGDEVIRRLEEQIRQAIASRQKSKYADFDFGTFEESQSGDKRTKKQPPANQIAAEFVEKYRDRLAWNITAQCWMRYEAEKPGIWSPEHDVSVEAAIKAELDCLPCFNTERGYSYAYLAEVTKFMRCELLVRNWDDTESRKLIPFQNGVLDVTTRELLDHAPGYRLTWQLPRAHSPQADDWSKINDFLDQATGYNTALKQILLCFCNATLKGRSDLQRFLHLIGVGGSGKGTFIRLLSDLIGVSNIHSTTLEDWCGNRFEVANAYRKRLIAFWDEDKKVGSLGKFKSLTGGDLLRGEEKGKKAFHFLFDGMVIIASNFPIFAGDNSSGMSRRTITVPFMNAIAPGQRRDLNAEFQAELAAFT